MNKRRHLIGLSACAIVSCGYAQSAWAAPIDTSSIVERTCKAVAGVQAKEVSKERLFGFLLSDLGVDEPHGTRLSYVTAAYNRRNETKSRTKVDDQIIFTINQLQSDLATDAAKPLVAVAPLKPAWQSPGALLADENKLSCENKDESTNDGSKEPVLRLRQSPETLLLNGDDRKTAASAEFGFKRERSFLEDGTKKIDKTVTVKAAVGTLLSDPLSDNNTALLYMAYELNRARSRPATVLVPPATIRDGDTEILKLGFVGHTLLSLGKDGTGPHFDIEVETGYLFDFVTDAERFRAKVGLSPGLAGLDIGICRFGALNDPSTALIPGVIGKCRVQGLFQVNHVTKAGLADYAASDEFVLAGVEAGIDLLLAGKLDSGIIASANYSYQKSIHGSVPDIDRFHGALRYRHWFGSAWALDLGFDYVDGTNPDSFADENILQLTFGVVF